MTWAYRAIQSAIRVSIFIVSISLYFGATASSKAQTGYFGTAKVNITPALPIRLSGYAGRSTESNGVEQELYAVAVAFGNGSDTALLIAVDCTGLRENIVEQVANSLGQNLDLAPERIVVTSTHTHSGPCVDGYATNLFGAPLPPNQQQRVEQYTQLLTDRLEEVALDALANRTPGHTLEWGQGRVTFGQNRRGSGVVDHDLPVLRVTDALGNTRSIITSYAAHAVALNAGDNLVGGDWPGYARERIEARYPGATALVMIGAAGDINPAPLGSTFAAQSHGQSIADEIERLVSNDLLIPITPSIVANHGHIDLPFATSLLPGDPGSARLAPAGTPDHRYGVGTWTFGDELAMVFLEGEVVVDYSVRLKSQHGDGRLWVNAYSNDVPGYIPSERILYEGGYEADSSGFYYALPGRFAHGVEEKIVDEVIRQLDPFFNPLDRLRLVVDRATGSASIVNLWNEPIEFDAYTIVSAEGHLSGPWNSLANQGMGGWEEADSTSAGRLTEFNPSGMTTLAAGAALQIGTPFSSPPPAAFGDALPEVELEFEYSSPDNSSRSGHIEWIDNPDRHNNLVLTIDPATGMAAIQNESTFFDVAISAYTITSATGRLRPTQEAWESLQAQGLAGWDQAENSNEFRVTEFNPQTSLPLEGGGLIVLLGTPIEIAGGPLDLADFGFEFLLSSGEIVDGVVEIGPLPHPPLLGDYDGDGVVDGEDYTEWRGQFGQSRSPGSGADGNGNGIVDAADYVLWRDSLGNAVAGEAVALPEPSAACMSALLGAAIVGFGRFAAWQYPNS